MKIYQHNKYMNTQQKEQIKLLTAKYVSGFASQNAAANSLKGVSSGTLSQLLNDKWELISDEMWRKIAAQVGYTQAGFEVVPTSNFMAIVRLLEDARANSHVYAITGDAGCGKTLAINKYSETSANVHVLQCNEYWNRKQFMSELLQAMGKDYNGYTVSEMMQLIVTTIQKQDTPLIIMDEADKLSDNVLYFFITLYNKLEDQCGIVMCATDHLEKRIVKGIRLNRKGYKEIFSRIGRKFINLKPASKKDISLICEANGVDAPLVVTQIINEAEGDLRRVKRLIHKTTLTQQEAA